MSDLHLEFQENSRYLKHNELPITGDVLVLAGDIFYLRDKVAPLTKFWKWASENYRQVLIVPGNHEYYNYSWWNEVCNGGGCSGQMSATIKIKLSVSMTSTLF
jgi:metallophosphoesterase superfamily enzyme